MTNARDQLGDDNGADEEDPRIDDDTADSEWPIEGWAFYTPDPPPQFEMPDREPTHPETEYPFS